MFKALCGLRLARRFGWILLMWMGGWSACGAASSAPSNTIVVVGDSISAEYGLVRDTGWVQLLRDRLREQHLDYSVVNASISGDTTANGLSRLPGLLAEHRPVLVVIELGGNDGLRGLPVATTEENLASMIQDCQKAHAKVLLVGMQLPPNYGAAYTERFAQMYGTLAQRYRTGLVPFLFAGFPEQLDLFQPDRIHPTAAAQPKLLDNVWPSLAPLLSAR